MERHPTTASWEFPPDNMEGVAAPFQRTNLRELAARPQRFEHHLVVCGSAGDGQIEFVSASEPLYFGHCNISDEYVLALPTGDEMLDSLRFLTLLTDPKSNEDAGRFKSGVGDLVLHPLGLRHWPGRLRPPFEPMDFPPGMRRTGLSFVYCSDRPQKAHPERPLGVSAGREAETKSYGGPVPFQLTQLNQEGNQVVARVGDSQIELMVAPEPTAPHTLLAPKGGYLLVLEGESPWFPCDLVWLPEGSELDCTGVARGLFFSSDRVADAPPPSWHETPEAPFAPFEEGERLELPLELPGGIRLEALSPTSARLFIAGKTAEVPRYWLSRMLFRLALHGYRLGRLNTYGGFFYDDRGSYRLGLEGAGAATLSRAELAQAVEQLYRAVPPPGYVERLR